MYCVRFQPFNNENKAELIWLMDHIAPDAKIIVGIVNPNPQRIDASDNPTNWKRFNSCYNPLSYWERYKSIQRVISAEHWEDVIEGIVPMPRPSVNMERANNYLPPKENRSICLPLILKSELERTKEFGLKRQNETIFEIPAYQFSKSEDKIISPELIACLIALHYREWDAFVPEAIRDYLKSSEVNIEKRIRRELYYDDAERELMEIYEQMPSELKIVMKEKFGEYL